MKGIVGFIATIRSKRLRLALGAATMVWLFGVVFAVNSTHVSAGSPGGAESAAEAAASRAEINRAFTRQVMQALAAQAPAAAQGQTRPFMVENTFKNVQELKGISVDEFMGTMGIMANSLGFCCNDCHTGAGTDTVKWEDDSNPNKRTARRMVAMVRGINKDNFQGRQVITCWTCHRGRDFPVVTEALDRVYGESDVELDDVLPPAKGVPTLDQILDKFTTAVGGAQKLAGITSFAAKGTGSGFFGIGGSAQIEIFAKSPDQRATYIHFPDAKRGDATRTFDGKTGWLATPLAIVRKYSLSAGELDGARIDAQLSFPGRIKQSLTNLRVGALTTVADRQVYIVQGNGQRNAFASLYFDRDSGLLTRVVRYTPSAIGRVGTQIDYSDYREVGTSGVKMPYGIIFSWLDGKDTIKLTDIQLNATIDPAKFGEPNPMAAVR